MVGVLVLFVLFLLYVCFFFVVVVVGVVVIGNCDVDVASVSVVVSVVGDVVGVRVVDGNIGDDGWLGWRR